MWLLGIPLLLLYWPLEWLGEGLQFVAVHIIWFVASIFGAMILWALTLCALVLVSYLQETEWWHYHHYKRQMAILARRTKRKMRRIARRG